MTGQTIPHRRTFFLNQALHNMVEDEYPASVINVPMTILDAANNYEVYGWLNTVMVDNFFCAEAINGTCYTNDNR